MTKKSTLPDWERLPADETRHDICRTKDGCYVVVDTQWIPKQEVWETMVFDSDKWGYISNKSRMNPIAAAYRHDMDDADEAHQKLCKSWREKARRGPERSSN